MRLLLAIILILTLAVPQAAAPASSCYRTGSGRKPVCVCGKYIVPMLFCKAVKR